MHTVDPSGDYSADDVTVRIAGIPVPKVPIWIGPKGARHQGKVLRLFRQVTIRIPQSSPVNANLSDMTREGDKVSLLVEGHDGRVVFDGVGWIEAGSDAGDERVWTMFVADRTSH